ncbi:MAG: hypothetical protein WBD07_03340 [Vicinamibacterales bacterium]
MFRVLLKTDVLTIGERAFPVRYFELRTQRGTSRYSADILIGPGDHIILDDDSISNLETRAPNVVPATIDSRALAARRTAA